MSRSGYSDDCENVQLWRHAVERAAKGARGQAMFRELADALDAMPAKRLHRGNFATADGELCTLGALGMKRGTKMDDLGGDGDADPQLVGQRFNIARALAAEIMYENDEGAPYWIGVETPYQRWARMRQWVADRLAGERLD